MERSTNQVADEVTAQFMKDLSKNMPSFCGHPITFRRETKLVQTQMNQFFKAKRMEAPSDKNSNKSQSIKSSYFESGMKTIQSLSEAGDSLILGK